MAIAVDREVIGLQEDFGLSVTNPAKLDHLVNSGRLNLGECFNEAPETEYLKVEIVSCAGEWQYRTLNSLTVDDFDQFPGEDLFSTQAYSECDRRWTITLPPTQDSWRLGERNTICLHEDFRLFATNPAKLDRLVDSGRLNLGECFNEAPETEYLKVEIVSCAGEWEYRTLNLFTVDDFDRFPAEDHFRQRAFSE